jgi:hypothetical protein
MIFADIIQRIFYLLEILGNPRLEQGDRGPSQKRLIQFLSDILGSNRERLNLQALYTLGKSFSCYTFTELVVVDYAASFS